MFEFFILKLYGIIDVKEVFYLKNFINLFVVIFLLQPLYIVRGGEGNQCRQSRICKLGSYI